MYKVVTVCLDFTVEIGATLLLRSMATRLFVILNIIVSLMICLMWSKEGHFTGFNISVTLLMLWYLFLTYHAALLLPLYSLLCKLGCGYVTIIDGLRAAFKFLKFGSLETISDVPGNVLLL